MAFRDDDLPTALRRDSFRQVTAYRSGDTPGRLRTRHADVREAYRVKVCAAVFLSSDKGFINPRYRPSD